MTLPDDSLTRIVLECLEHLFGTFPPPEGGGRVDDPPWDQAVGVLFNGEPKGCFRLDFFGGARSFLFSRWAGGPVPQDEENDAAGELANIICCNVLPALFGPRALFQVDRPRRLSPLMGGGGNPLAIARIPLREGLIEARIMPGEDL